MGPTSYMRSIEDRNIVMRCIPVLLMVPTGLLHHRNCNNCKIQYENIVLSLRLMYIEWRNLYSENQITTEMMNPGVCWTHQLYPGLVPAGACVCVCVCVCKSSMSSLSGCPCCRLWHPCLSVCLTAWPHLCTLRSGGNWPFLLIIHVCQHQSCHC